MSVLDATKSSPVDVSTVLPVTEVKMNDAKILTTPTPKATQLLEIKDKHTTTSEEVPSSSVELAFSAVEKDGEESPQNADVISPDLNEPTESSLLLLSSVSTVRTPTNRFGVKVAQSKKNYDQPAHEEMGELAPTPAFPLFPSHSHGRPMQQDPAKSEATRNSESGGKLSEMDYSAKKTFPSKGTPGKTETKYSLRWPPAGHIPGEQKGATRNFTSNYSKKRPAVLPIPGEGVCRIGGIVYQNGQPFASRDPCKIDCHCINSVILCTDVICEQKPETPDNCQKIIDATKCCPEYVCENETSSVLTTSSTTIYKVDTTVPPVLSDKIDFITEDHPSSDEESTTYKHPTHPNEAAGEKSTSEKESSTFPASTTEEFDGTSTQKPEDESSTIKTVSSTTTDIDTTTSPILSGDIHLNVNDHPSFDEESTASKPSAHTDEAASETNISEQESYNFPSTTTEKFDGTSTQKLEDESSTVKTVSSTTTYIDMTTSSIISDDIHISLKDHLSSEEESAASEHPTHTNEAAGEKNISEKEAFTFPPSTTENYDAHSTQNSEDITASVQAISSTTIKYFETTTVPKPSEAIDYELKNLTSLDEKASDSELSIDTSEDYDKKIITEKQASTFPSSTTEEFDGPSTQKPEDELSTIKTGSSTTTYIDTATSPTLSGDIHPNVKDHPSSDEESAASEPPTHTNEAAGEKNISEKESSPFPSSATENYDTHSTQNSGDITASVQASSSTTMKYFETTTVPKPTEANDLGLKDLTSFDEEKASSESSIDTSEASDEEIITEKVLSVDLHDDVAVTFTPTSKDEITTTQSTPETDTDEFQNTFSTNPPQNIILSSSDIPSKDLDKNENVLDTTTKVILDATIHQINPSMNDSYSTLIVEHQKDEEKIKFTTESKTHETTFLSNSITETTGEASTKNSEDKHSTQSVDVEDVTVENVVSHSVITNEVPQSATVTLKIDSDQDAEVSIPGVLVSNKPETSPPEAAAVEELRFPTPIPTETTPVLTQEVTDEIKIAIAEEHPHKIIDTSDHDELLSSSSDEKVFKPEVDEVFVVNEDGHFTEVDKHVTVIADKESESTHSFSEKSTETQEMTHPITSEVSIQHSSIPGGISQSVDKHYTEVHEISTAIVHEDLSSESPHKFSDKSTEIQEVAHPTTSVVNIQTTPVPEIIDLSEDENNNEADKIATVIAHKDVTSESYHTVANPPTSVVNIHDTSVEEEINLSEKKHYTEISTVIYEEDVTSESSHSFSEKSTETPEVTHQTTSEMNVQNTFSPEKTSLSGDKHFTDVGEITTFITHEDDTLASAHSFADKSTETEEVSHPTTSVINIQDTTVKKEIILPKDKPYTEREEIFTDISHEEVTSESSQSFSDMSTVTQEVTHSTTSVISIQDTSIKEGINLSKDKPYTEEELTTAIFHKDVTSESSHTFTEKSTVTNEIKQPSTSVMNVQSTSIPEETSPSEDKHFTKVDEITIDETYEDVTLAPSHSFLDKSTEKQYVVHPTSGLKIKNTSVPEEINLFEDKNYNELDKITTINAGNDVTSESSPSFSESTEKQEVVHTTTLANSIQDISTSEETNLSDDKRYTEIDSIATVIADEDTATESSHIVTENPLIGSKTGTHNEIVLNVGPSAFTKLGHGNAPNASDIYVIQINNTISEMIEIKTPAASHEENDQKYGMESNENLFAITITPFQSNEEHLTTSTELNPFELKSTTEQKLPSTEIINNTQFTEEEKVDPHKVIDLSAEKVTVTDTTQKADSEAISLKVSTTENIESTETQFTVTSISESTTIPSIQAHNDDSNSRDVEKDLSTPVRQTSSQSFETVPEPALIKVPEGDILTAQGSAIQPENLLMENTNRLEVSPHEHAAPESLSSSTINSEITTHDPISSISVDSKDNLKEQQAISTATYLTHNSTYSFTDENTHHPSKPEESIEENTTPEKANDLEDSEITAADLHLGSVSSLITVSEKIQQPFVSSTAEDINGESTVASPTGGLKELQTDSYDNTVETTSLQFQNPLTDDGSLDYDSNYSSNAAEMKLNSSSLIIEQFTIPDSDESDQHSFTMLTTKANSSSLENTSDGIYNLHSFTQTIEENDFSTEREPLLPSSTGFEETSEEPEKEQDSMKKTEYTTPSVSSTVYFTESYTDKISTMTEIKASSENKKKETLQTTELSEEPSLVTDQHHIEEFSSTMKTSTGTAAVSEKIPTDLSSSDVTQQSSSFPPTENKEKEEELQTDAALITNKIFTLPEKEESHHENQNVGLSSISDDKENTSGLTENITTEIITELPHSTSVSQHFTSDYPTSFTDPKSILSTTEKYSDSTEESSNEILETERLGVLIDQKNVHSTSVDEINDLSEESTNIIMNSNDQDKENASSAASTNDSHKIFEEPKLTSFENTETTLDTSGGSQFSVGTDEDEESVNIISENNGQEKGNTSPTASTNDNHKIFEEPKLTSFENTETTMDTSGGSQFSVGTDEDEESVNIIPENNSQEKENTSPTASKNDSHIVFEEPKVENVTQDKIILPTTATLYTTEGYSKNSDTIQLGDSSSKLSALLTTHPYLSTLIEARTTVRPSSPTITSVDVPTTSEHPPTKLVCLYNGDVYHSAEEVPRADPCEFCFCFRGEIICLQQTCPPPIHGCFATPIRGFCCPRFHCPVQEKYFNSTSPFEAIPRSRLSYMLQKTPSATGCEIEGVIYRIHQLVRPSSGPCMQCRCEAGGVMRCDPRDCQPQPPLVLRLNRDFFKRK
ncbi:mucin-2-like [Uloborus diversus]|uniref:mucin-2-like n=1 Tax=Uloborus diversus TaxID=327109 RepID=UPI00240A721E|nr:mucin-2-like [Uloborus diversus]